MALYSCLRCFTQTDAEKASDLTCATCAGRGEEPIWKGTVTIADSETDGVPEGRVHTLILPDEKFTTSAEGIQSVLEEDSVEHDVVAEKAIEAALDIEPEKAEDATQVVLGTLDALAADKSPEAKAWKETRLADPGAGLGAVDSVEP